jgi:hypothetical protein
MQNLRLSLLVVGLAALISAGRIQAQNALVLQGGGWLIDQDASVVAARAEFPLGRNGNWLLVPGITYARGEFKSSPRSSLLIPEIRFDREISHGKIRPFFGMGGGFSIGNLVDRQSSEMLTAASGVRADLGANWGVRMELEMRLAGGFVAGSAGWGLGIAHHF